MTRSNVFYLDLRLENLMVNRTGELVIGDRGSRAHKADPTPPTGAYYTDRIIGMIGKRRTGKDGKVEVMQSVDRAKWTKLSAETDVTWQHLVTVMHADLVALLYLFVIAHLKSNSVLSVDNLKHYHSGGRMQWLSDGVAGTWTFTYDDTLLETSYDNTVVDKVKQCCIRLYDVPEAFTSFTNSFPDEDDYYHNGMVPEKPAEGLFFAASS
jgi:hypothetical protein